MSQSSQNNIETQDFFSSAVLKPERLLSQSRSLL